MKKKVSRREFIQKTSSMGIGALGVMLMGGHTFAAKKPLIIVGFDGGTWQQYHDQVVSMPFAKKHNCKIVYEVGTTSDRITKCFAEKESPTVDCSKFDTTTIGQCIDLGIVEEMDENIVNNLKDVHPLFKNKVWSARVVATFGLVYNKEKIPSGLNSWWDLWDPKYKGKVGLPVFEWMGDSFSSMVNTMAGGSPDNLDPGISKLKDYVKNQDPIFVNNTDHGIQMFTRGELWAAPFWDGRTRNLQDNKVPVEFVFPKEGAAPLGYGLALNQGSDVKELTEKYINYSLDPQVQIAYSRKTKYPPTNLKAIEALPSELERVKIPAEAMDNMLVLDYYGYSKVVDKRLERWNKEVVTA